MTIKKAFQPIMALLTENENSKVKTILPAVIELCSAKTGASGAPLFRKNDEGEVTHVFCYYHKMWEDVRECEFGAKATSATGLNNMCKEGVSAWTKQKNAAKKANAAILDGVVAGDIAPADIPAEQEKIDIERKVIVPRADGHGFTDEQMAG